MNDMQDWKGITYESTTTASSNVDWFCTICKKGGHTKKHHKDFSDIYEQGNTFEGVEKAQCPKCGTRNMHYKDGCLDCGYKDPSFEEQELSGGSLYRYYISIMEKKIGRNLIKGEVVHHIDGDRQNNNPDNLMLFKNRKEHNNFHRIQRENSNFPYLWKGKNKEYKKEWYKENRERILDKLSEERKCHKNL